MAGKTFEFHRYQAHHAFTNSERKEVYDPEATKLAWERTMRFLGKYLD